MAARRGGALIQVNVCGKFAVRVFPSLSSIRRMRAYKGVVKRDADDRQTTVSQKSGLLFETGFSIGVNSGGEQGQSGKFAIEGRAKSPVREFRFSYQSRDSAAVNHLFVR
jgi:hypothetical protein